MNISKFPAFQLNYLKNTTYILSCLEIKVNRGGVYFIPFLESTHPRPVGEARTRREIEEDVLSMECSSTVCVCVLCLNARV